MHTYDELNERERILVENIINTNAESNFYRSSQAYIDQNPGKSTTIQCYEFGASDLRTRFGSAYGIRSGSGICIFERLCWTNGNLEVRWARGDVSDKYPFLKAAVEPKEFDWPPCLTCHTKVTSREFTNGADSMFNGVTWIDEPTYFAIHSYERHVTHFMEPITSINAAVHRLSKEQLYGKANNNILPNSRTGESGRRRLLLQSNKNVKVRLVNHAANLFNWQMKAVHVALQTEKNVNILQGAPENNVCYRRALVPGYVFELFNDFLSANDFRNDAYTLLGLPPSPIGKNKQMEQPVLQIAQIIYAQRTAKRKLMNREEVLAKILTLPTRKNIKISVKSILQSKLTFKEQVENMESSRVLIGMHGADLTNCMFLRKGSVMIEINPLNWYDSRFVRMCETAGIHYLSYNDGGKVAAPYPFAHFPSLQCSFINKPLNDCKMDDRTSERESNVLIDMSKFEAIMGEALYLAGVGPRVVYSAFENEFKITKAYAWKDNQVVRYPSLKSL
eukprot:g8662.t1